MAYYIQDAFAGMSAERDAWIKDLIPLSVMIHETDHHAGLDGEVTFEKIHGRTLPRKRAMGNEKAYRAPLSASGLLYAATEMENHAKYNE